MYFHYWGNFGGPGWRDGRPGNDSPPSTWGSAADTLDSQFKAHDTDYWWARENLKNTGDQAQYWKDIAAADAALLEALENMGVPEDMEMAGAREGALMIFRFKEIFNYYEFTAEVTGMDERWGPFLGSPYTAIPILVYSSLDAAEQWTEGRRSVDPLVLDLDSDGIEAIGIDVSNPVLFDHNSDGTRTATGWIIPDDGFLVLDRNGNGFVDSGRELFGDNTLLPNGSLASNGYEALAVLDTNNDGGVSAADQNFAALRVWQDSNQDGVSQAAELRSLATLGISSISVVASPSNVDLGNGNTQPFSGTFQRVDGSMAFSGAASLTGSLLLANNSFFREFTDDPALAAGVHALPMMSGSGWVRDLAPAMSLGGEAAAALQNAVRNFAQASDRVAQRELVDEVLFAWAETSGRLVHATNGLYSLVTEGNMRTTGDANGTGTVQITLPDRYYTEQTGVSGSTGRVLTPEGLEVLRQLHVTEVFSGMRFVQIPLEGGSGGSPFVSLGNGQSGGTLSQGPQYIGTLSDAQVQLLQQSWAALKETVYGNMALQTRLYSYVQGIAVISDEGGMHIDYSALHAALDTAHTEHPASALRDLADLIRDGGFLLESDAGSFVATLHGWIEALPADSPLRAEFADLGIHLDSATASNTSDLWFGGASGRTLNADAGNDHVFGGASGDVLHGGEGYDKIWGNGGNDHLLGGINDDVLWGGLGADTLEGHADNDTMFGEAGNDTLQGGLGNDKLDGGAGNDSLFGGWRSDAHNYIDGFGNDTYLFGRGDGSDTVWDADATAGAVDRIVFKTGVLPADVQVLRLPNSDGVTSNHLTLRLAGTADQISVTNYFVGDATTSALVEEIRFTDAPGTVWSVANVKAMALIGAAGNDRLTGYATDDVLRGNDGHDTIDALDGNDTAFGGAGDDSIHGNDGNDTLYGEAGNDTLNGRVGDDVLDGGVGNDTLVGGWWSPAHNYIDGFGNDTYLFGRGDGQDIVWDTDSTLGAFDKVVFKAGVLPGDVQVLRLPDGNGQVNNLTLRIAGTADQITVVNYFYNNGPDSLIEEIRFADVPGTVWSVADVKAMSLTGGPGDDVLTGNENDNVLHGNDGNDSLNGRGGNDTLYAGAGNDALMGDEGNDTLYGEAGDDTLNGRVGDDLLDGGAGNDTLVGGWWSPAHNYIDGFGNDTYLFGRGDGNDTVWDVDATTGAVDKIVFKAGVLPADIQVLRLPDANGSVNNLTLRIAGTTDQVSVVNYFYNDRTDALIEEIRFTDAPGTVWSVADVKAMALVGGAGNDVLTGYQTDDVLRGNAGNDGLNGRAGNDILYAGAGNDSLAGDEGNDILYGEAGDDTLNGRVGDDVLDGGAGNDMLCGGLNILGSHNYIDGFGNDTYVFGRGYGSDQVWEKDGTAGAVDAIVFNADLSPADLEVAVDRSSLILRISGTAEQIWVANHFLDGGREWGVEQLRFNDPYGTVLTRADIDAALANGNRFPTGVVLSGGGTLTGTAYSDTITGSAYGSTLSGQGGKDILQAAQDGSVFDLTFRGGAGDDLLRGSYARDFYEFNLGDGRDTITDDVRSLNADVAAYFAANPTTDTYQDLLRFGSGITAASVVRTRVGNDLVLSAGAADSVTIKNWFDGTIFNKIETIAFADGTTWNAEQAEQGFVTGITASGSGTVTGTSANDTLTAVAYGTVLSGLSGNDVLKAAADGAVFDVSFRGGAGDDSLTGSYARDLYQFSLGDGRDTIADDVRSLNADVAAYFAANPTAETYQDKLQFGAGITATSVMRSRAGNDLVLAVNANDSVTVKDWFDGTIFNKIETIAFADGSTWTPAQAEQGLVQGITQSGSGTLTGTSADDLLSASGYGTTLVGDSGNDVLATTPNGSIFDITFRGGAGNDDLTGSYARDFYEFNLGDGKDTIRDDVRSLNSDVAAYFAANPTAETYQDHLRFGVGISAASVTRSKVGDDLVLAVNATDDVTIKNWFDGTIFTKIESIEFADGTIWTAEAAEAGLIQGATLSGSGTLTGTSVADTLTATGYGTTLLGRGGDDVLSTVADGSVFDITFRGGAGNDTLLGSYARDFYKFELGDGHDTIRDDVRSLNADVAAYFAGNPAQDTYQDELLFGLGISPGQVTRTRSGDDLVLGVSASESVTIDDWFDGTVFNKIEVIGFADGTRWTAAVTEQGL
jgi:Ca2+-binding RTX toxin-like protein